MDAVANGRALPPRPTLLVGKAGDVDACRSSWSQLQPVAVALLRRAEAGCASAEELDSAVRRFRSLRESLVAAYVRDDLAVQVYEASADVCLAASCWPEFLKSVATLTCDLYPARDGDLHNHHNRNNHHNNHRGPDTTAAGAASTERSGRCGPNGAAGTSGCLGSDSAPDGTPDSSGGGGRRCEMVSAHCLFLACVPSGRLADAAVQLRNPRGLSYMMSSQAGRALLQYTAKVLSCLASGDWYRYLALRDTAPRPNLRAILDIRASHVRTAALRCLAAALRSLPLLAAVRLLRLDQGLDLAPDNTTQPGKGNEVGGHGKGGGQPYCCGERGTWGPEMATRGTVSEVGVEEVAALRAVLEAAAAAGVRGAQVALQGLAAASAPSSAWEDEDAVGRGGVHRIALSAELCFRSS